LILYLHKSGIIDLNKVDPIKESNTEKSPKVKSARSKKGLTGSPRDKIVQKN